MESKESLRTLCGFKGDEKELDLRNKGLTAGCAVLVSNEIKDMGALAKLDLSKNNTNRIDGKRPADQSPDFIRPIASMLKTNRTIKELNLAGNNLNAEAARIFSQDIHDNGALASLNLANNNLTNYGNDMSGIVALAGALPKW